MPSRGAGLYNHPSTFTCTVGKKVPFKSAQKAYAYSKSQDKNSPTTNLLRSLVNNGGEGPNFDMCNAYVSVLASEATPECDNKIADMIAALGVEATKGAGCNCPNPCTSSIVLKPRGDSFSCKSETNYDLDDGERTKSMAVVVGCSDPLVKDSKITIFCECK